MASVEENRKDERVAFGEHVLVDHRVGELARGLQIALDVVKFVALLPDAGVPGGVFRWAEKRILAHVTPTMAASAENGYIRRIVASCETGARERTMPSSAYSSGSNSTVFQSGFVPRSSS